MTPMVRRSGGRLRREGEEFITGTKLRKVGMANRRPRRRRNCTHMSAGDRRQAAALSSGRFNSQPFVHSFAGVDPRTFRETRTDFATDSRSGSMPTGRVDQTIDCKDRRVASKDHVHELRAR